VIGLTNGLSVEDFDISSADATVGGASSIAMIVNGSKNVRLSRVTITAGKGADGERGRDGNNGIDGLVAGTKQAGLPAVCSSLNGQYGGYWEGGDSPAPGGNGGTGYKNNVGVDGNYGSPQTNVTPANVDNSGPGATVLGQNASPGTQGSKGNDGPSAAATFVRSHFDPTGYSVGYGPSGIDGFPGQGGGGGGSSRGSLTCLGASGGAGGCGGLGGKHGTGGFSGGVSVGMLVWDSTVSLTNVTLVSSTGGAGGDGGNGGFGGKGQPGAAGGKGDFTNRVGAAGDGGKGADGGNGGAGQGGDGGHSYPLVFRGTAPIRTSVTYTPGQPGLRGAGGLSGAVRAPSGIDGDVATERQLP
jgi:hypothetical protein